MDFLKENLRKLLLSAYIFFAPIFVFAAENCNPAEGKVCNPINAKTIQEFIKVILEGVIRIGMPIVALAVIYCGFLFVSARGKPEAITKAKDALLYTLIGAAILLGSWAIAQVISNTVTAL